MRLAVLPLITLSASFAFSRPLGASEGLGARNAAIYPRALETTDAMMPRLVIEAEETQLVRRQGDNSPTPKDSSGWENLDRHQRSQMAAGLPVNPPKKQKGKYVYMSYAHAVQLSFPLEYPLCGNLGGRIWTIIILIRKTYLASLI